MTGSDVSRRAGLRGSLPDLTDVKAPPAHWMWAGRLLARSILRAGYDNRVHGVELVPRRGPVILASNHIGYVDGPLLVGVAPRPVHALVKQTMFVGRLGYVLTQLGQIPIDRVRVDPLAIKTALRVLADGGVVAIYPEGIRGLGDVSCTKGGAAYLALVTGAPVVPVACLGTREPGALTETKPRRGARLDTVFGTPLRFRPTPWPRTKPHVAAVQAEIQAALAAHVRAACELTGQSLPAMPTTSPVPI